VEAVCQKTDYNDISEAWENAGDRIKSWQYSSNCDGTCLVAKTAE